MLVWFEKAFKARTVLRYENCNQWMKYDDLGFSSSYVTSRNKHISNVQGEQTTYLNNKFPIVPDFILFCFK